MSRPVMAVVVGDRTGWEVNNAVGTKAFSWWEHYRELIRAYGPGDFIPQLYMKCWAETLSCVQGKVLRN